ncbi:MAG TPA: 50S ribosomal protein L32e [Candidatus Thermoplasmatota archaeon]|nr:50S ribosomal protein L32e [Candidatus Thermoplasmatota archaeon]
MTREDTIKEFAKIPGVGEKKAEALYDAGFTSMEKLKRATKEDLLAVEGVGPKLAEAILKGVAELSAPPAAEEEQRIEVVEESAREERKGRPKPKKEKVEIVEEAERVYRTRAKPKLDEATRKALALRRELSRRRPDFPRDQWFRYKKIDRNVWRRPMGISNKQLKMYRYRPAVPKAGYGGPAAVRGLHPSGFEEVLVHNAADLSKVNPDTQAARVGGSVGARTRETIEKEAAARGVRILNPRRGSK